MLAYRTQSLCRVWLLAVTGLGAIACSDDPLVVTTPDTGPVCKPTTGCGEVPRDAGVSDDGVADAGVVDSGAQDATADTGADDAEIDAGPDLGPADTGVVDLGPIDMGNPDLGTPDNGCPAPTTDWTNLGRPRNAVAQAMTPADVPHLITSADLKVQLAWTEGLPADVHVQEFDGNRWAAVAPPIGLQMGDTPASTPKLASLGGRLAVSWVEGGAAIPVAAYAAEAVAGTWNQLGGGVLSTDATAVTGNHFIADEAQGRFIAAFAQGQPNRVRVVGVANNAVTDLGTGIAGGGGMQAFFTPRLVIDSAGILTLAFSGSGVFIQQRRAGQWGPHPSGSIMASGGFLHSPRLAANASDLFVFLGEFATNTTSGYVFKDQAGAFQSVGSQQDNLPGSTFVTTHEVAIDSVGRPVIAYTEGVFNGPSTLYVRRFDGSEFVDLGVGPLMGPGGRVGAATMAIDACDRPVVAYTDTDASNERVIYVFRYGGG